MIKIPAHSPEAEGHLAQEEELLDQMTEVCATAKVLKRSCDDLRALLDQVPRPEILALLERTEARYREAVEHLIQIYTPLIEPDPSLKVIAAMWRESGRPDKE